MNTKPIFDYLTELETNHKYSKIETEDTNALMKNDADYIQILMSMKHEFEACVFQCVSESQTFKSEIKVIANKLSSIIAKYNDRKKDSFRSKLLGNEDKISCLMAEESIQYLKQNYSIFPDIETTSTTQQESASTTQPIKPSKFQRTLDEYGDLLSVKDLTNIFRCDRKTIYNWERKGYLVNVKETSEETNVLGKKKRGEEKRFRKEAILKRMELQEKFNLVN